MIDIKQKLKDIDEKVYQVLGKQIDNVVVIRDKESFNKYVDDCISKEYIAIDTETNNSTDVENCIIMGLCLYAPSLKQAYVPINHRDIDTNKRLDYQLTEKDVKEVLQKVIDNKTYVVMHNGKFDVKVLKHTCDIFIEPNWDTMIAAKLINENESASLKWQYIDKIDKDQTKYSIDELFEDVEYALVKPETFAIYAATDSKMTYDLCLYQYNEFFKKSGYEELYKLFTDVEMPIVGITAKMEMRGISIDQNLASKLKDKYEKKLSDVDNEITSILNKLKSVIDNWRSSAKASQRLIIYETEKDSERTLDKRVKSHPYIDSTNERRYKFGNKAGDVLKDPINLNAPIQRSILVYDVLGAYGVNIFKPKSCGAKELQQVAKNIKLYWDKQGVDLAYSDDDEELLYSDDLEEYSEDYNFEEGNSNIRPCFENKEIGQLAINLCILLRIRQGLNKLINSYLKVVPKLCSHWKDGNIRFNFNSIGTQTGRFSSGGKFMFLTDGKKDSIQTLNMQNIPSKNHEIRLMFVPPKGRVLVGGDFSQQEAKITSYLSREPKLLEACEQNLDLYAKFAQGLFKNNYQDNLEFDKDGKLNVEGKKRRKKAKTLFLAVGYGMGIQSFASQIGEEYDEAKIKYDSFFEEYPMVEKTIEESKERCKLYGYVEDIKGRRRHIPKVCLPPYDVYYIDAPYINNNRPDDKIREYVRKLNDKSNGVLSKKEINEIIKAARNERIIIKSNRDIIIENERKCFNSIIQGSAATLTKFTMIQIDRDPLLNQLGAHMLLQVHDEVILDCPSENAEKATERLKQIMNNSSYLLGITIPFGCDTVIEKHWGEIEFSADVRKEYKELETQMSSDEAINKILGKYPEFSETSLRKLVSTEDGLIEI